MSDIDIIFNIIRCYPGISNKEMFRQSEIHGVTKTTISSRRVDLILGGFIYTLDSGLTYYPTVSANLLPYGTEVIIDDADAERLQLRNRGGRVMGRRAILGMLQRLYAEAAARVVPVEEEVPVEEVPDELDVAAE